MSAATHQRVPSSRTRLARAAIGSIALGLAALAPSARAQTPPLVHDYQLQGGLAPDVWLTSSVACGVLNCDIQHTIVSVPIDALVQVTWKRQDGSTLMNASTANLWNFHDPELWGGKLDAVAWNEGVTGSAWISQPIVTAPGTADFTGSIGILPPCGGFVCDDASYYTWGGTMAGTGGSAGGGGGGGGAVVPNAPGDPAPVSLGTITGTLAVIGVDPEDPTSNLPEDRVPFVEFSSSVDLVGGAYVYRYVLTNLTDNLVEFDWEAAGLAGELAAFGSMTREVGSPAAPGVIGTTPGWMLSDGEPFPTTASFSAGLRMFAPVPEPGTWATLAAGLAVLAAVGARRSR
jgi:hypothetical protein